MDVDPTAPDDEWTVVVGPLGCAMVVVDDATVVEEDVVDDDVDEDVEVVDVVATPPVGDRAHSTDA